MIQFTTSVSNLPGKLSRLPASALLRRYSTVNHVEKAHLNRSIPVANQKRSLKYIPRRSPSNASTEIPSKVSPSPLLNLWVGRSCDIIYEDAETTIASRQAHPQISRPSWSKMKSSVQFLTTPTVDTNGTALLLSFADRRYLIGNIHEGTQRACIQRGVRVAKVSDIFLTGKTEWKNTGGLIGMILNIADTTQSAAAAIHHAEKERLEKKAQRLSQMHPKERAKQSKVESLHPKPPEKHSITIHGGPNITHTLATARRFVFRKGMPVDVNEFRETEGERDWEPTWSDQRIQVWAMSIEPSSSHGPTRPASPQSSRKRSFDEYRENRQHDEKIISKEKADRNQQLRRAVVCDMFDSDWRLDALIEVPIAQVHMPATLFVRNPDTKKIENYSGPIPGSKEPLPDLNVLVRRPWPGALVAELPPTKPSEVSLSYIIRNHRQRGKFLPDKAKALNIETRSFSQLVEGRSVVSKDGITILPEQVLEKDKSGTGFAIIELPSRDYVQNLVNRPEWRVDKIMEGVEMFIWILGPGVGQDQTLMKFMTDFSHMKHIVSSQDECPNILSLDSSAAAAIRRNQMDPDRYPVPIHHNSLPQREERNPDSTSHPHSIVASRGLMIDLEPRLLIKEETSIRPLNTAEVLKDTDKDIIVHAKAIRQDIASEKFQTEMKQQNLPSPEAEMIFLGTGSALPSKYRNVSATLLRVPGSGSYLLDCGENTLGQLSRVYTSEELLEVFQDLKMIWISHLHADHHLGTTSVIKAWYQAVYGKDYSSLEVADTTLQDQFSNPAKIISEQKRLFVASDHSMIQWLKEYASVEDFGYDKIIPLNVTGARLHNPDSTELDWNRMPLTFKPSGTEMLVFQVRTYLFHS